MDRLRRSLRESFRRKKEHVPECSKPHQWQADEVAVRSGTCNFPVKYLGCVEVFESRGMQVCEEALKVLRNSRRRPIKGILYVTGDGLRVVDDETKGLIVDQTIEKVSFCAPDRNHDKGFSYICRDGTTRRWMCHGFLAVKDSGERLSHAVGCAFAACLERKQKRDKECGVTMTFDPNNSTFTRSGSFRQTSLTERMQDPQDCKPADDLKILPPTNRVSKLPQDPPPVKSVHNPFAIERPHATPMMLQRQGSFRGFTQLGQSSPFKRQLSLRLNDLPSTLERQRSLSLESPDFSRQNGPDKTLPLDDDSSSPQLPPRVPRNRLHSLPNAVNMSPILESSPVVERQDTISAMCQQVSQGLSLLSNTDDPFLKSTQSQQSYVQAPPPVAAETCAQPLATTCTDNRHSMMNGQHAGPSLYAHTNQTAYGTANHVVSSQSYTQPQPAFHSNTMNHQSFTGPPTYTVYSSVSHMTPSQAPTTVMSSKAFSNTVDAHPTNPWSESSEVGTGPSAAEEWLASAGSIPKSSSNPSDLFASQFNGALSSVGPVPTVRRAPHLTHLRSQSVGECSSPRTEPWTNGTAAVATTALRDPFDAEWAALAAARSQPSTNPFQQNSMKAFEVQM